jgi:Cu+-exporting ATPase
MVLQTQSKANLGVQAGVCFHCEEALDLSKLEEYPKMDDKSFCCEGCKTVFEILNSNDLCRYYEIGEKPGFSLRGRKKREYEWLEDQEIIDKIIDFTDGKISKVTFFIPQMHCASCIWLLENLHKLSAGIIISKVNFMKKEAYLSFNCAETTLRKIVELLVSIGYEPEFNLDSIENKRKPVSRRLIYQIGIAGFAFGNIMLLSFPEYIGLSESDTFFKTVFGYLNLLLAIPVVLYSGRDYLTGAWHSLRTWNPGIDIPLALGIIVLFFRSAFEILTETGAGYMDSLAGLVFFLLVGKWFQQMTYHQISFERDYRSYFPIAATKMFPDGKSSSLAVNKLVPGDIILVKHKEIIPADGILKRGEARIDYSFVSGETSPIEVMAGGKLYAGGRQMGESIQILLSAKVSQSYLTQLWNEDTFEHSKMLGASKLANYISRYFTLTILTIAFIALIFWLPKDKQIAFQAFTAVLIIACPCAAALNVPFTLGNAIKILSKKGFFLKNTNALEVLVKVNTIVFDKTGTLTEADGNQLEYFGEPLSQEYQGVFAELANQSTHPVSKLIARQFMVEGKRPCLSGFEEREGLGIRGRVGDSDFAIGSLKYMELLSCDIQRISDRGSVYLMADGRITGYFLLRNKYRKSSWSVIDYFQRDKETYLLSGDNDQEKELLESKFDHSATLTGSAQHVFFNQSPKQKLDFIKKLQQAGKKVLMVGDGLNDAGALKQSDLGIVVAENTNNFTPACEGIVDAARFGMLPAFFKYSQGAIKLVFAAWFLAAIYNIIGLYFAVQGLLSPVVAAVLMPASSLTIVLFGIVSSTILARRLLK